MAAAEAMDEDDDDDKEPFPALVEEKAVANEADFGLPATDPFAFFTPPPPPPFRPEASTKPPFPFPLPLPLLFPPPRSKSNVKRCRSERDANTASTREVSE
jgi:hypothetical protein